MYEHMLNWKLVHRDQARITAKGNESILIHDSVSNEILISITGNRNDITMAIIFYPHKFIPVYGF